MSIKRYGVEGGTGYNHAVTMGRSRNVWGPYEPDPKGPLDRKSVV